MITYSMKETEVILYPITNDMTFQVSVIFARKFLISQSLPKTTVTKGNLARVPIRIKWPGSSAIGKSDGWANASICEAVGHSLSQAIGMAMAKQTELFGGHEYE